ncbi:DsbA family protein [Apilactobacillus apinorum]|uniref:DsbA family protein n=1 Tax=Apilactobacillus apinorum TaxID=1218495 RepID=UPI0009F9997A
MELIVRYKNLNGGVKLFELFLFIDPLCKACRNSENTVLKISEDVDSKFKLQFIPIYNLKVVQTDYCNSNNQLKKRLSSEQLADLYKNVVLDYKAALFQGMKKGRKFLTEMQDCLLTDALSYSDEMAISIAEDCGLDVDMFIEDRRSNLAKNAIKKDQELVQNMKIEKPASAVIFNCENSKDGILTDNIEYSTLFNACCDKNLTTEYLQDALSEDNLNETKMKHFRIIK